MNRLFLVLFALSPLLTAAEDGPSSKEVILRFTSFGLADNGGDYVLAAEEKLGDPFVIPDNGFSLPIPAPSAAKSFALGKAGAPQFQSLASIRLPETGKRFLVILLPGKNDLVRAIMIRADDPSFRPGNVMIMNLAAETLAGDLGGKKLRFTPGSQTVFRPQREDDLANYQIRLFHSKSGKPKLFAASLWPYFDGKRAFVFLYVDPASGSPTYRSIDEFTDWLAAGSAKEKENRENE